MPTLAKNKAPGDVSDERYMRMALGLAGRGQGNTWPNPAVGCVLVRDGFPVGRGWTQSGGRPHAETEALRRAGAAARNSRAYVTLEPCAHHGATPPCADALIEAGISACVIGTKDPDPRVNGAGIARLRAAGIDVVTDVLADEARDMVAAFILRVTRNRPLITLKLASSLDGRIATHGGDSKWITGDAARRRGQLLRARHDAVLVGVGTVLADDPELNCRLPGLGRHSPVRIVLDGHLRLPLTSRLVRSAKDVPLWLVTAHDTDPLRREAYQDCGVELIAVGHGESGRIDLKQVLGACAERGVTSVLVEGGGRVAAGFLGADLVDRLAWFSAPRLVGGDGTAAIAALGLDRLALARNWRRLSVEQIGDDLLETCARPL